MEENKLKVYVGYNPIHYTDQKVIGLYRICYIKSDEEVYRIKKLYFYNRTHNKITKLLTDQKILEIIGDGPGKDYYSVISYRSYEETEERILEEFKKNSMRWEIHEILYHYNR